MLFPEILVKSLVNFRCLPTENGEFSGTLYHNFCFSYRYAADNRKIYAKLANGFELYSESAVERQRKRAVRKVRIGFCVGEFLMMSISYPFVLTSEYNNLNSVYATFLMRLTIFLTCSFPIYHIEGIMDVECDGGELCCNRSFVCRIIFPGLWNVEAKRH